MLERVRSAVRWVTEDRRRFILTAVATAGLGLVPVLALPTNSDVAWLLYAAERVLEGETLYVDLIEVNPPLVVWLSLPPVAVARELGVASRAAFIPYVAAVAGLSLVVAGRTLPHVLPRRSVAFRRAVWLLLLAAALVIPDWVYGQREHLMLLFVLPYLVGSAGRAAGRTLPRALRLAASLMAGVGIALKPYFIPFWLALEAWIWLRRRQDAGADGYRPWCLENLVIGGVLVVYVAAVLVFAPEFFTMARRLAPIYVGVRQDSFRGLALHPVALLTAFAAIAVAATRLPRGPRELAVALTLASVAWLAGVFLQMKGWWYHYYPSFAGSTVAVGLLLSTPLNRTARVRLGKLVGVMALVVLVGIGIGRVRTARTAVTEGADLDRRLSETTQLVERLTGPGDHVTVLSPYIHAAFPLINQVDAGWNLRFNSMWPPEVLYAEAIAGVAPVEYRSPLEMGEAERYFWDAMLTDLERNPPELLLLDRERTYENVDFDYRNYFGRAASFRRLMRNCRVVAELARYRIHRCGS